jgi:predicted  nucleic acid-binding Zn-ribbon protein
MKLFMIKLLTGIAVVLTMYASVVIVHEDASENSKDITTLNRKIVLLEDTIEELNSKADSLTILVKSLRTSVQEREINVDKKVQEAVDNKFKEQSATGSLGTLTGEHIPLEEDDG